MLEALTAIISVFAASTTTPAMVTEVRVDARGDTAEESRAQRIARMRAKMRSSGPRTSTVRCAHAACDPCKTDAEESTQAARLARTSAGTTSNRAGAVQPASCKQSEA